MRKTTYEKNWIHLQNFYVSEQYDHFSGVKFENKYCIYASASVALYIFFYDFEMDNISTQFLLK